MLIIKHISLYRNINNLGDTYSLSFNYAPLIGGLLILFCSSIYTYRVVRFGYKFFKSSKEETDENKMYYAQENTNIDKIYEKASEYETDEEFNKSLELYKRLDSKEDIDRVSRELAKEHIAAGDYDEAISVYESSMMNEQAEAIRNLKKRKMDDSF